MRRACCLLILLLLGSPLFAQVPPPDKLPAYLQDISLTIRAGRSEGSGVAFVRDGQGFVWTAAHVVDGLRRTRQVIDSASGTTRTVVEFDNAQLIKVLVEDGRTVGRIEMDAEVLRFSDIEYGEDLALLRVLKKDFLRASAAFSTEKTITPIGSRLLHVGSLLGQFGSNSMTDGIMSQHGRLIGKKEYDQTTVTAFPGSSGGGVYNEKGEYVGMLTRGAGEGFNLIVPVRRMRAWAEKAKITWAMDPKVPLPSVEEMAKLPIEDTGVSFHYDRAAAKQPSGPPAMKLWLHRLPEPPKPPAPTSDTVEKLIELYGR